MSEMQEHRKVGKKLSKESEEYRAIRQLMVTLKDDMQALENRVKDKDLIEKIYLKELESKKSEVSRLTQ
jgi:hypothetical protein